MGDDDRLPQQPAFWDEQAADDRFEMRRQAVRWTLTFVLLFGGVFFAFWWSGSAVHFSALRVNGMATATYEVTGIVTDAATGAPIPWPEVADDPSGPPPWFSGESGPNGNFRLLTIPAPHDIHIRANGYKLQVVHVGKQWFGWWPSGSQQITVRLPPE